MFSGGGSGLARPRSAEFEEKLEETEEPGDEGDGVFRGKFAGEGTGRGKRVGEPMNRGLGRAGDIAGRMGTALLTPETLDRGLG